MSVCPADARGALRRVRMEGMDRRDDYPLAPGKTFLNHGSFGATPLAVLQRARALRTEAESDFPAFYHERVFPLLEASRRSVCAHLGVAPDRGVFVRNSTTAMQTVVDHLALRDGDHVVTTSREYEATVVLMRLLAGRGVDVEVVDGRHAGLVDRVLAACRPRTRAVVVSHVTSPWSQVNDVDALSAALADRGVATVVDGAHTAGQLPLPLHRPGVFVCLTLHKWLHLPKGAGFLVVPGRRGRRACGRSSPAGTPSPTTSRAASPGRAPTTSSPTSSAPRRSPTSASSRTTACTTTGTS